MAKGLFCAILVVFFNTFVSCTTQAPTDSSTEVAKAVEQTIIEPDYGIAFALPTNWVEEQTDHQRIFSGPAGSPEYLTTITVQQVSTQWHQSPRAALDQILKRSTDFRPRSLTTYSTVLTGTQAVHPALWYSIELRHHREHFRRTGILIAVDEKLLEIQYTAPTTAYTLSHPVFENLVASLSIEP